MKFTDQNRSCHPERSEGSVAIGSEILRFAQDDMRPASITDLGC